MKRIILFIFMTSLIMSLGVSCKKDWLNPASENILIPEDTTFNRPENATKFVNSVYAQLTDWQVSVFSWLGVSSMTSDDADKGSDPGDNGTDKDQMDNFSYGPTSLSPREVWNGNFIGVGRANQAIDKVPLFNIPQALKDRLIGEAKFLRAFYYFNLVRCFGDVPKIERVFTSDSIELITAAYIRAPKSEIYDLMIADLLDASAKLPLKTEYAPADLGRATKGAAQGLLAKVYMYQKNWAQAMAMSDLVISSNIYSLESNYAVIWRQSSENGPESVFEIQGQNGAEGWGIGGYSEIQRARGTVTGGFGGWGFNTPTADLEAAYETGDVRKDATIYKRGQTLWDGAVVANDVTNPRYSYKAYASQTQETNYDGWNTNKNIRILRYAEVLLINAEAANEIGQTAKALTNLNLVRARARGGAPGVLPDITTTDQGLLRAAIWKERRVELAMEHDRFFDLVRQGRAGPVLRAHGKNFVDNKHELFPIPLNEILISQGKLTQNPGY
jgi:starch-binding outer membrane protein, SusD/RagB family